MVQAVNEGMGPTAGISPRSILKSSPNMYGTDVVAALTRVVTTTSVSSTPLVDTNLSPMDSPRNPESHLPCIHRQRLSYCHSQGERHVSVVIWSLAVILSHINQTKQPRQHTLWPRCAGKWWWGFLHLLQDLKH